MADEIWRDRRGALGGQQEKEYCEQHCIPLVDPITAIKAVLRAVNYTAPVRLVSREVGEDGAPRIRDEIVTRVEVLNAVGRLPFPLKESIELVYLQNMSREAAAAKLGMGVSTLGNYQAQAFDALVQMIFDYSTA